MQKHLKAWRIGCQVLYGQEGLDWQYYVTCEIYWQKWGELNRN